MVDEEEKVVALDAVACAAFWDEVKKDERWLSGLDSRELVDELNGWLEPLAPRLAAEVCGEAPARREIVITAHGSTGQFENVLELTRRAPAMESFIACAFRLRSEDGSFGMQMDDFKLSTEDVLITHAAEEGRIAIRIAFRNEIPMDCVDHAKNMAFIMLDHVLGEYDFAIKVGAVDFAEAGEEPQGIPLDQFRAVFDAFWVNDLGRTGLFPDGEHGWTAMTATHGETGSERLILRNDSANALVGRADLCTTLTVSLAVTSNEELDVVRDFEERLSAEMLRSQSGICTHVVLADNVRTMVWSVGDAELARQAARSALAAVPWAPESLATAFDPAWDDYLGWAD